VQDRTRPRREHFHLDLQHFPTQEVVRETVLGLWVQLSHFRPYARLSFTKAIMTGSESPSLQDAHQGPPDQLTLVTCANAHLGRSLPVERTRHKQCVLLYLENAPQKQGYSSSHYPTIATFWRPSYTPIPPGNSGVMKELAWHSINT